MEEETNTTPDLVEDTNVELSQQVLDESGELADESIISITTTVTQSVTLGELKSQLSDLDERLSNLESFYQNQKTFLEGEKQKVSDQIAQIQ